MKRNKTTYVCFLLFVFVTSLCVVLLHERAVRNVTLSHNTVQHPFIQDSVVKKTNFMTVKGNGRLGNQMFQVATLLATALYHNYTPVISDYHRIKQCFNLTNIADIQVENSKMFNENKAGIYNKKIGNLTHATNWTLIGYFQSWKYFHSYRNEITSLFSFKHQTKYKAMKIVRSLNAAGRTFVGVHVRRGDKAQPSDLKMGNSVATPQYIVKALQFFRRNTSNPIFVVVSDSFLWTREHVRGTDVQYVGTGNPEIDLAVLSLCNHTIITVGSFGWWGAYLNRGITVYYSNFPRPGSWLATQYKHDDYYLPEWIGIE